ncbi:MAG: glycosyltransferase [Synechococcales cyanobacterium RM1_1_8]|nr:glycosyltransferase [Synechococcales cyanobacterium RM1_1_8]
MFHGPGALGRGGGALGQGAGTRAGEPLVSLHAGPPADRSGPSGSGGSCGQLCPSQDDSVSWFHYGLGEALFKAGQGAAAIPHLERAIALNPGFPWAYYYLGLALLEENDHGAAIATFQTGQIKTGQIKTVQLKTVQLKTGQLKTGQTFTEGDSLQNGLAYAQFLQQQDQRLRDYCQARDREREGSARHRQKQVNPDQANPDQTTPNQTHQRLDILLITPYPIYPPQQGAATRMFHQAKALAKHHRLAITSLISAPEEHRSVADLADHFDLVLVALMGDMDPAVNSAADFAVAPPSSIQKYSSRRLRKMLTQLQVVNFDIVCCDFIYMAQYMDLFPQAYRVLGEHNIESALSQRMALLQPGRSGQSEQPEQPKRDAIAEGHDATENHATEHDATEHDATEQQTMQRAARELAAYETAQWPLFDLRTTVSTLDRDQLQGRCPGLETWVVPNGIDTQAKPLLANHQARKLLFFGTLNYFPNIDGAMFLAQSIMPLIWAVEPDLRLCIAGANPPPSLVALALDPRIEVLANPAVMEDIAQDCHISLVSLRAGSGTRIKILHALAMGLPTVSTTLGCEGLAVRDGEELLIRDDPASFAAAVLELEGDRALWQHLRSQGRALVEQQYDWQNIYADYGKRLLERYRERWEQR